MKGNTADVCLETTGNVKKGETVKYLARCKKEKKDKKITTKYIYK
jgi:hypothetical protein